MTNTKKKREVANDEEEESNMKNTTTTEDFFSVAADGFEEVLGGWKKLLPSTIGCMASVAGCDFCYYFLATYNMSLTPAACNGGCSLSVVGSYTALVTDSVAKTFG